jgi:hypothetical protein
VSNRFKDDEYGKDEKNNNPFIPPAFESGDIGFGIAPLYSGLSGEFPFIA